jgi:hypothetical protein
MKLFIKYGSILIQWFTRGVKHSGKTFFKKEKDFVVTKSFLFILKVSGYSPMAAIKAADILL